MMQLHTAFLFFVKFIILREVHYFSEYIYQDFLTIYVKSIGFCASYFQLPIPIPMLPKMTDTAYTGSICATLLKGHIY